MLTVNVAPAITGQPTNVTVCAGLPAGFCVTATGSPLNYQWQFNGTNISGATDSCYTLTNVQPSQAGNYSVVVSNSCGRVTSSNAVLTVNVAPVITGQPTNLTVCAGSAAGFCVTATGSPLNYQWQFNGTNISGATGSCYTLTNVQPSQAGIYSVVVSNSCGWVTSSNAVLTVNVAPVITWQPINVTTNVGGIATFTVVATGTPNPNYQWYFNSGEPLPNAANAVLTLTNVQREGGALFVMVSNGCGWVMSSNAVLTVLPCASVSSGMVSWWSGEGNANDIVGDNSGMLVGGVGFEAGEVGQAFSFDGSSGYVSIPDSPSLDSLTTSITIEFWMQAGQTNVNADWAGLVTKGNSSWQLTATSGANTVYWGLSSDVDFFDVTGTRNVNDGQWHHVAATYDGTNMFLYVDGTLDVSQPATGLIDQTGDPVCIGANSQAYVPDCDCNETGYFFNGLIDEVSIYNRALSTSEIQTIYTAGSYGKCPPAPAPPVITSQPADQTVYVHDTVTFTVAVSGSRPLSCQWSFNGTNIPDATNSFLTLTDVQTNQTGNYAVFVSNAYGSVLSSNAVLTVLAIPPIIITQPTDQTVYAGGTATFTVEAGGTLPLSYQWSLNGTNLPGATDPTLTLTNVQTNQAGNYAVLVSNPYGSILSSNALLTVLAIPPIIITQPANQTVFVGGIARFSVVATGPLPLTYQWSFNGTNISGATNTSLILTNVQLSQAGYYTVLVSNPFGSILSSNAWLTVNVPPPCTPMPSGLIGCWRGEGNALDSAGTNNGILYGGVTYDNERLGWDLRLVHMDISKFPPTPI